MKASIVDGMWWTPERGALSAEDGLGKLSRFARSCAAVSERILVPDAETPVVLGTKSGAAQAASTITEQLLDRWPGTRLTVVSSGLETVPASLLEACIALRRSPRVLWVVAELHPGAELVAALLLARTGGATLSIARLPQVAPPPAAHLNPCAAILALERATATESVSIGVGSWLLTREPTP